MIFANNMTKTTPTPKDIREEKKYMEIETVTFSNVVEVFLAWVLRGRLRWHYDKLKVNGKEIN